MKRLIAALLLAIVCSPIAVTKEVVHTPTPSWRCLAWVVHDESRGEPLKGSRAVLDVVKKRMKDSGKSACEVVAEPKQFSGYSERKLYEEVSDEALHRYKRVAKMKPVAVECKYFHAVTVRPAWATKFKPCIRIGKHIFYKEKKHDTSSKQRHRPR